MGGETIERVKTFSYVGLELTERGVGAARQITTRVAKARGAMGTISRSWDLSLETAIALFNIKIVPMAVYGIELIWEHLGGKQFEELDRLKAAFLKRAMGVHRTARNRIVFLLASEPLLTEELQRRRGLPETRAYKSTWRGGR